MRKNLLIILLILYLSIAISGCNLFNSRFRSSDPFYRSSGEADFLRIPLIKPYDAIKGDEKYGWTIDLFSSSEESTFYVSIKGVEKIAIRDEVIYIHTSYKDESAEGLGKNVLYWFVLIPKQGIEKGFESESDYLEYLQNSEMEKPTWVNPNEVFQQFEKTGCLDWIPGCKVSD